MSEQCFLLLWIAPYQSRLDKLKALTGADFDKEYHELQFNTHEEIMSLFQRFSYGGDHPDLKLFAVQQLPLLREQLRMAQELKK